MPLLGFDRARHAARLWRRLLRPHAREPAQDAAAHRLRLRGAGARLHPARAARRPARCRGDRAGRAAVRGAGRMRLLFLGDVVGRSGRDAVSSRLPGLIDALRLRFRRRQRREREPRPRPHRGPLQRSPRCRRRRRHARRPRLRPARHAELYRARADADPADQHARRNARAAAPTSSPAATASRCW